MSTNFGSYLQSTPRIFKVTLPQVSLSIRHLQKTHMLIEIDYNTRTLLIGHAENAHVKQDWIKSRTLFGTHRNFTSQMSMTCRTLFSALGKRTCKLIQRAQKTHMSIKVDYKCHSLFGKHRKRTCQVRLGTHRKCTCQVRLTSSLALYSDSAQTEDFWIFFPILKLSLWVEWIPVSHWIDTGIKLFSLNTL